MTAAADFSTLIKTSHNESTVGLAPGDQCAPLPMEDPTRYANAKALFCELCDLASSEREQRLQALDSAGGESAELATLVRTLLEHENAPDLQRFGAPIAGLLADLANTEELTPGTKLGAWTLTRKIGEGGMGSVYEAQRSDGHFEQAAAIKLLRGVPSPAALKFLASERQILAGLTHPNIARLLDGGATPKGQPYLVMEYLDGLTIDQFCRQHKAPVGTVLRLMIEVCGAVSFAHSRLIVHCDLKPSNILVDHHGRPFLLDFGIARLLGNERADSADAARDARAFTPGCASPEQESGGSISTLTDVYSLGRLLQELLAGVPAGRNAMRMFVTRELRAIVAMATQINPAARYGSAAALSRDLTRYLAHEAVQAIPTDWSYRTTKILQRRWPVVLALSVFALTVAAFTWQLALDRDRALVAEQRALAARDQATQASTAARQINAFLGNILSSVDPDNARSMDRTLMRTLLDQAAARARNELKGQPVIRRQIETVVADSYRAISEYNAAVLHYELALQTFDQATAEANGVRNELELQYKRIVALIDANRLTEAQVLLLPSIASAEKMLGPNDELTLKLCTQQAYQLFRAGQLKAALSSAQDTQRRFEASHAITPEAWLQQLNILSLLLSNSDQFTAAEALMQRAVAVATKSFGPLHSRTLRSRHSLAVLLLQSKRRSDAVNVLKPLLADMERALGPTALLTISAVSNLGTALRGSGQLADSAQYYRLAYERSLEKFGALDALTLDMANNLALYEIAAGKPQQALARMQPVIAASERLHGRLHPSLIEALRTRAKAFSALRQNVQARMSWRDVVARDLELYGPKDSTTTSDQAALAALEGRKM